MDTPSDPPPAPVPPTADQVKRIADGYLEATKQITDVVKYIGAGLIGLFFAAVTSSSVAMSAIADDSPLLMSSIAILGVGCLLLDYVNHLMRRCTYANILDAIDQDKPLHRSPDGQHLLFDQTDPYYYWARRFFKAKQWCAALVCIVVIYLFAKYAFVNLFPNVMGA